MAKKKQKTTRVKNCQWWRADELDRRPHEVLDGLIKQIEDDQAGRYQAYREYERLFGATEGPGGDFSFTVASDDLTQNELQNTIETLWAQVFKNKVAPAVSTSEADWEEWDRARSYSRWLEGVFDEAKVYTDAFPRAGAYSLVHGTGCIRVGYEECAEVSGGTGKYAKIKAWPVNPRNFAVDRLESKHGRPRSIFFKDHVDRDVLLETYGVDREDFYGSVEERIGGIDHCTANDDIDLPSNSTDRCDMLTVREAFHLPSGPKAKDGKHAIWVKGCTLVYEEFTWDTFPCVFMRFGVRMEGFYGESAVRRIAPLQKNLDKLTRKIDEAQDVMGVPRIIVGNNGEGLRVQHVDDIPGGILVVGGSVNNIKDWNAQCASQELYADRDSAGPKMRALLGISEFESTQQIPQRLRELSGPALERMVEQGQAKHAMFHGEYEQAVVDLADIMARQAEDLQSAGYDMVVKGPADGAYGSEKTSSIESLSFKDVHVDRAKLKIRVQPMSQLPQTFTGKVDAIAKLRNEAGVSVDPKTVMRMIEVPDVNQANDMMVSDEEIIFKNLSYMVKNKSFLPPLPFDNHDLIIQMTTRYINRYRVRNDADNDVVGLLAQYIDEAILLKKGLGNDPNAPPGTQETAGMGQMGGSPMGTGAPMLGAPGAGMGAPGGLPPELQGPPAGMPMSGGPGGQAPGMGVPSPMGM